MTTGQKGELYLDGAWTDVTGDLYARDPISITRGRPYRSNAADPASCSVTFNNEDGKYTPRNAVGPYYGSLGRNTPFRVSVAGGYTYLQTVGDTDGVSTPDASALDITGDIDIRIDVAMDDWHPTDFVELCGKWDFPSERAWFVTLRDGKLGIDWTTDGTGTSPRFAEVSTVVPFVSGQRGAVRLTLDVNNGAGGVTLTAYTASTIDGPWTLLGTTTVSGTTSIASTAAALYIGAVSLTALADPVGRYYAFQMRDGIDGTLVADADFTAQTPGATSFTDSTGLTWTVRGDATLDDRYVRFTGEVPEWPPRWDPAESDPQSSVQPAGILRRLGQGQRPLQSTLRRKVPQVSNLLAYWPMEEGSAATQASSPVPGVRPLTLTPAKWGSVEGPPSSESLPAVSGGTLLKGVALRPSSSPASWMVQWLYRLDTVNADQHSFMRILSTGGSVAEFNVSWGSGLATVRGIDSSGATVVEHSVSISDDLWGQWIAVYFEIDQTGSTVHCTLAWRDIGGDAGALQTTYTGTIGYPVAVTSPLGGFASDLAGMGLGHISIWSAWSTTTVGAYLGAADAYDGETAAARMTRLCDEENIPLTIVGDQDSTALVGPQRPAELLDLLREAAAADGGIFGERLDRPELIYRTRTSLYNQEPKLVLDYTGGDVAPPFEPVEDDQIRNSWEVTRNGGSSGYAVLEDGPLSVQAPPDGIGLYQESVTLNLNSDDQTEPMAGWLLHLSTWDEARYPAVTVRLHKTPELVPDVLDLDVGDLIRIENLPSHFTGSSTADLLVDGWSETLEPFRWEVTFNCSPAGPWRVGVVADEDDPTVAGDAPTLVDTDGSELAADATSTDTVLDVTTPEGNTAWATSADYPDSFPFDVSVGGETVTVSAITQAVSDGFDRSVTGGWGTADSAQEWTTEGGAAADYAVSSGTGRHICNTRNAFRNTVLPVDLTDVDLTVDWTMSATPVGDSNYVFLCVRRADDTHMYFTRVQITAAGGMFLNLRKRNGSETLLGSGVDTGLTHTAGTWYRLRFAIDGTTLQAKLWVRGTAEPSTWALTATDSDLTGPGSVALRTLLGGSTTNTLPVTIQFDNLQSAGQEQRFIVTRSVNGVVKPQAAGTDVRLADPAIVAL